MLQREVEDLKKLKTAVREHQLGLVLPDMARQEALHPAGHETI